MRRKLFKHRRVLVYLCACAFISWMLLVNTIRGYGRWDVIGPAPYPPLAWHVNNTHRVPEEVQHVAFLKVHKAAGSTLFNIFIRFSMSRELNVIFPREGHLLSESASHITPLIHHPPSPPFFFDILCNHMVFDQRKVRHLLHPDSVYVTILRDPLSQMQSAYDYYKHTLHMAYLKQSKNFSDFLINAHLYEPADPYLSFTNNRMSLDLGLPPDQIHNSSYIPTFINHVKNTFHLVLIADKFDESLVLLKRRLRWTMKDVVYAKLNQRIDVYSDGISPSLEHLFRRRNQFDIALYDYFLRRFERLVQDEGRGFYDEVATVHGLATTVTSFCEIFHSNAKLKLPKRRWNKEFMFEVSECRTLYLMDPVLTETAKYWQQVRMPV